MILDLLSERNEGLRGKDDFRGLTKFSTDRRPGNQRRREMVLARLEAVP
jgi:hypothetical protein